MFSVPAQILAKTTKCPHDFACLQTNRCGDSPMCVVETAHAENVLGVRAAGWPNCSYHLEFGGARFCVCPVRCWLYQQPKA